MKKKQAKIGARLAIGIDPGLKGALLITDGVHAIDWVAMPTLVMEPFGERVNGEMVEGHLMNWNRNIACGKPCSVFLERAKPMAMGSTYAFNYGMDFMATMLAVERTGLPTRLVEAHTWAKVMHEGTDPNLRPKARSEAALLLRYPRAFEQLPRTPKSKRLLDGPMDAFLIGTHGLGLPDTGAGTERFQAAVQATLAQALLPPRKCPFCGQKTMVAGRCRRMGCDSDDVGTFY